MKRLIIPSEQALDNALDEIYLEVIDDGSSENIFDGMGGAGDEIRAVSFNSAAQKLCEIVEVGKIFRISNINRARPGGIAYGTVPLEDAWRTDQWKLRHVCAMLDFTRTNAFVTWKAYGPNADATPRRSAFGQAVCAVLSATTCTNSPRRKESSKCAHAHASPCMRRGKYR